MMKDEKWRYKMKIFMSNRNRIQKKKREKKFLVKEDRDEAGSDANEQEIIDMDNANTERIKL